MNETVQLLARLRVNAFSESSHLQPATVDLGQMLQAPCMIVAVQLVQQDSQSSKLLSQWRVARSFRSGHSQKLTSIIVENSCHVMAPHPQHTHQAQEHGIHQLQGLSTQELTKSQHLSTLEDKCLHAHRYPAIATATVLFVHWTRCRSGQVFVCERCPLHKASLHVLRLGPMLPTTSWARPAARSLKSTLTYERLSQ